MRIVSYDGKHDLPYENISLEVCNKSIYAGGKSLGNYKSKERCLEIMKGIRFQYFCYKRGKVTIGEAERNNINDINYFEMPKE